ncbi:polymorphic toxin-type HINT domain-containing protein [Streptomyces sp. NPDC001984]
MACYAPVDPIGYGMLNQLLFLTCAGMGEESGCGTQVDMSLARMIANVYAFHISTGDGIGGLKVGRGRGSSARVGDCMCFLAGTGVLMENGKRKSIEKIHAGDKVLAADPKTGKQTLRRVIRKIVNDTDKDFSALTIADREATSHITATTGHPFWDVDDHRWVKAGQLRPGDHLMTAGGETAEVLANRHFSTHARTYNLTIQGVHTYYVLAGETPVLVHNSNCSSNAKILGDNLEASGVTRPADTAAHYIVASTSPKAAAARQQLAKFGIDINDASNGVFLPRGSASANPTGASVHSRIHTDDYYAYVNDLIGGARNANEARDVLGHLRRQLQGGYWP